MALGRLASGILGVVAIALGALVAAPFMVTLLVPLIASAGGLG
jgi:hypothetical protein